MARVREYDLTFKYTMGGSGIGVVIVDDPYGDVGRMTFMREGPSLMVAEGHPANRLDGGHFAEDWHLVAGELREELDDETPGLIKQVEETFRLGATPRQVRAAEEREARIDAERSRKRERTVHAILAVEVRKWLKLKGGRDLAGTRVYAHAAPVDQDGYATIVYDGAPWAAEFCQWMAEEEDSGRRVIEARVDVWPMSSYEIAIDVHDAAPGRAVRRAKAKPKPKARPKVKVKTTRSPLAQARADAAAAGKNGMFKE